MWKCVAEWISHVIFTVVMYPYLCACACLWVGMWVWIKTAGPHTALIFVQPILAITVTDNPGLVEHCSFFWGAPSMSAHKAISSQLTSLCCSTQQYPLRRLGTASLIPRRCHHVVDMLFLDGICRGQGISLIIRVVCSDGVGGGWQGGRAGGGALAGRVGEVLEGRVC